jgi:flap endonuclease-1
MGVNLSDIITAKTIELDEMNGRRIAIDAFNTIYQFLSSIRDRFTGEPLKDSKGQVTSHLSGLFYRTTKLLENGIKPVYVFDGMPPPFKHETRQAREETREKARERLEEARKEGDVEKIRRYAQQTSRLTKEMIGESKRLLESMGVPVIQAPSEGEAQAALLASEGKVWASGSQDWDSLLFGAPRMVKNLAITGRRKVPRKEDYIEIRPEVIELEKVLSELGITREQLVMIGMLIGTDYNPGGIRGIGPKNALKIVTEQKTFERVFGSIKWDFGTKPEEIFRFFMNPPAESCEINELKPDYNQLKEILLSHEFSEERIEKNSERLKKAGGSGQGTLHSFLKGG